MNLPGIIIHLMHPTTRRSHTKPLEALQSTVSPPGKQFGVILTAATRNLDTMRGEGQVRVHLPTATSSPLDRNTTTAW